MVESNLRYRVYGNFLNCFVLKRISVDICFFVLQCGSCHVDVALANFLEHSIKQYNNDVLEASKLLCLWLLQERFRKDFTIAVGWM